MHCAKATALLDAEGAAPADCGDPLEPVEAELLLHATVSSATPAITVSKPVRCGHAWCQRRRAPVPVFISLPPLDRANF
jgi:hypothetical protein